MKRLKISAIVVLVVACLAYAGVCGSIYFNQRSLIFHPPKKELSTTHETWTESGEYFGLKREVRSATVAWLFLTGDGGQAAGLGKPTLDKMEASASFYLVDYPGYGRRAGTPSRDSINAAVRKAYDAVVAKGFKEVGVIGLSLGSGPASMLAKAQRPPDKIVLVVPYDSIASVSEGRYPVLSPFLPVRLLLTEGWDNIAALQNYAGKVEIFAAKDDRIIPNKHAKNLAASIKGTIYTEVAGAHSDWIKKETGVVFTIK